MPQYSIYDVYWDGPHNWKKRKEKKHHVLYQISGTHPVYGNDLGTLQRLLSDED